MQKETQVIHWVEHKEEKVPECHNNRSHSDPTANEAIGNVMREERRKEKLLKEQLPQKQQEFDRTFEVGNRPLLKDVLTWFDNGTILHIGSRSAFYFIGTRRIWRLLKAICRQARTKRERRHEKRFLYLSVRSLRCIPNLILPRA